MRESYRTHLLQALKIIYANPGITRSELASQLQVSERTTSNLAGYLLEHHCIVIHNYRAGRWYPPKGVC